MTEVPDSAKWVPLFAKFIHDVTSGDCEAWDLYKDADPLKRVLHLRYRRKLSKTDVLPLRDLLKIWCKANDCVYKHSEWGGKDFKALIILKGLGPVMEKVPG